MLESYFHSIEHVNIDLNLFQQIIMKKGNEGGDDAHFFECSPAYVTLAVGIYYFRLTFKYH